MKATFIGLNGSMGLVKNKMYNIEVVKGNYPINLKIQESSYRKILCPYNSLEALLKNWLIIVE